MARPCSLLVSLCLLVTLVLTPRSARADGPHDMSGLMVVLAPLVIAPFVVAGVATYKNTDSWRREQDASRTWVMTGISTGAVLTFVGGGFLWENRHDLSAGTVALGAVVGVIGATTLTTGIGAALTHEPPAPKLRGVPTGPRTREVSFMLPAVRF